jgi:hypothetical protein
MTEPLLINGLKVDPRLLEARPLRRCRLEECQGHCCGGGAFIRLAERDTVLARPELFQPYLPAVRRDPRAWFTNEIEPDDDHPAGGQGVWTAVMDDPSHPFDSCCMFLRPDRKCALQMTGIAEGNPWQYKPFYCALHPLTYDQHWLMFDDANPMFQLGGSCCRPSGGDSIPLYRLFADEVKLVLGESGYKQLETLSAMHE